MTIMLTRGSAFTGFARDALTVQSESVDRPLYGALEASWTFVAGYLPVPGVSRGIVAALERSLSDRPSNAVQELLTATAAELLESIAELAAITLGFSSLALSPLPVDLWPPGSPEDSHVHEIGTGARGMTEVTLGRA
jgi:urate oxidase